MRNIRYYIFCLLEIEYRLELIKKAILAYCVSLGFFLLG